jgi:type IV pilus assembly protein PilB
MGVKMTERIGEIFLRKKLVRHEQLEAALQEQIHTGEFLGQVLMRLGYATEEQVLRILAEQFHTRYVLLAEETVNPAAVKLVPRETIYQHRIMPVDLRNKVLLIAVSNPLDMWPLSLLQEQLRLDDVHFVLAKEKDIQDLIKKHYGDSL